MPGLGLGLGLGAMPTDNIGALAGGWFLPTGKVASDGVSGSAMSLGQPAALTAFQYNNSWTLIVKFKRNVGTLGNTIIARADNTNVQYRLTAGGSNNMDGNIGGTALTSLTSVATANTRWHIAMLRCNGTQGVVGCDGVIGTATTIAGTQLAASRDVMCFAQRATSNSNTALHFNGSICDIQAYNRAITDDEFRQLTGASVTSFVPGLVSWVSYDQSVGIFVDRCLAATTITLSGGASYASDAADALYRGRLTGYGDSTMAGSGSETSAPWTRRDILRTNYVEDNKGVGGETSLQIVDRFYTDTATNIATANGFMVLQAGRNDVPGGMTTTLAQAKRWAARIPHRRWLILSPWPKCDGTENDGTTENNNIRNYIAQATAAFGDQFINCYQMWLDNAIPGEEAYVAVGRPPPRFFADTVHPKDIGYDLLANTVYARKVRLGM